MKKSLKILLLALVITLSVWALVIFYWQVISYAPTNVDLFSYLVLVPAALFVSVMVLNKVSAFVLRPKEEVGEKSEATNEDGQAAKVVSVATGRDWVLPLAFGRLITLHGDTVSDFKSAVDEKTNKFELDTELADVEGFPLMSARIAGLEPEETYEKFEEWLAEHPTTEAESTHWITEDKRTLHLLHSVFTGLLRDFFSNDHIAQLLSNYLENNKLPLPNIYIVTNVPNGWTQARLNITNDWLRSELLRQGWPGDKILNVPINDKKLNAWQILDSINESIHASDKQGAYFIAAAQSHLGERTFAEYEAAGQLLSAQNKSGNIYGEAGAGVLVLDEQLAKMFEEPPVVFMHRAAIRLRDKSADDSGKIKPSVLIEVMKDALLVSKIEAENIKILAADTDSRVSRITEFFAAQNEVLPEIDTEKGILKLQECCGMVGAAAGLASLVYAMDRVVNEEAPALWVSNTDAFNRCALVLNLPIKPKLEEAESS